MRDLDPFIKKKYYKYAAQVNEVILGNNFLKRMQVDIKKRISKYY